MSSGAPGRQEPGRDHGGVVAVTSGARPAGSGGRNARRRARAQPPPLPQRDGLDPVRWTIPPSAAPAPALDALRARFPALSGPGATPLADRFARGEVVARDGQPWSAEQPVGPHDQLWFHRELRPEQVEQVELSILHRDRHLLVLDKPHDLATMPRGAHVLASALVRLRRATGITALTPLHRLDRRTAGVLAFGIVPAERGAYQQLFARGEVRKEYLARVMPRAGATVPLRPGERTTMRDHLRKARGELTTTVLPGPVNAVTELEVLGTDDDGAVRLHLVPHTGRTHQLRAQLAARGAPIVGEDLYPVPCPGPPCSLQLLARRLAFVDPVTGEPRRFTSRQELGPRSRTLGR